MTQKSKRKFKLLTLFIVLIAVVGSTLYRSNRKSGMRQGSSENMPMGCGGGPPSEQVDSSGKDDKSRLNLGSSRQALLSRPKGSKLTCIISKWKKIWDDNGS